MYIPNVETQNYPFCRLKLIVVMIFGLLVWNQQPHQIKVPRVLSKRIRKRGYESFGTSIIISSSMYPPFLPD